MTIYQEIECPECGGMGEIEVSQGEDGFDGKKCYKENWDSNHCRKCPLLKECQRLKEKGERVSKPWKHISRDQSGLSAYE